MNEHTVDCFKSIDGNWILKPVGYCTYHKGYVSERQAKVHRCHRKHGGTCGRLKDMEGRYIKKMRTDQYYDKMISRMDKMIITLEKIVRNLEAEQKTGDGMYVSLTDSRVHLEAKDSNSDYGNITIE